MDAVLNLAEIAAGLAHQNIPVQRCPLEGVAGIQFKRSDRMAEQAGHQFRDAIVKGLLAGGLQARFLFSRNCHKNLDRIAELEHPRLWQFYRPGFFVALAIMIAAGVTLSRLAHGTYGFLIAVGSVELNVGIALLGSIHVYWQREAFRPEGSQPPAA